MPAAAYTGVQALLDGRVGLQAGYVLWIGSLVLMLLAPVVSRFERRRKKRKQQASGTDLVVKRTRSEVDMENKEPEMVV